MQQLDDTDLQILAHLAEDARRPYSEIASAVGLSGPAVSDRVQRLREAGVIRRFTVHLDRSQLRAGAPVFVQAAPDDADAVLEQVTSADAVEHVFETADGEVWFYARAETGQVRRWLDGLFEGHDVDYAVTLLDGVEWTPSVSGAEFALTCVECGNTVDAEGESARIDGDVYHFCCPSCRARFEERYERFEAEA